MPDLSLILFDDAVSRGWEPFALTRPAGELRFGTMTFRERAERLFGGRVLGHLAAEHLAGFAEPGAAPVLAEIPTEGDRLFIAARSVPGWGSGDTWR